MENLLANSFMAGLVIASELELNSSCVLVARNPLCILHIKGTEGPVYYYFVNDVR